jgi:Tol biopolymer transport system component
VVDIASGETKRLINVAPDFQRITWAGRSIAPDGRLLVTGAPRRAPHPDSAVAALRLFSVGGAEDGRVLRQWPADVRWVEELAWSPAQTHVWVLVNREKTIDIASVAIEDGSILTAKTLASRGPGSVSASLSPDGRFLAYHHSDGAASPRDLFLVSGDGSREVRLEHPANDSNPLFTPDGSGIVFQSDREGGAVWFLPIVDGRPAGAARAVWDDLGLGGQLMQFAENGSLLYKSGGNRWEIYAADIDLERGTVGPPQLIPPLGAEINNAPAFSPDGRVLAHLRNMGRRLVLRDLASGGEREFPIAGPLVAPVIDFCPSGQSVVVTGYEYPGPNTAAVYRVDLQRGGAARLRVAIEPFTAAACVGNGREVVYVTPREHPEAVSEVVRQSLDTGAVTTLHDAARVGVIRSNDGRMIGFTARVNNKEQLVVMPTSGGKAVPLGVSATNQEGAMWLPDTGGLLFVRPSDGTDPRSPSLEETFMRLPLDGGAPAEVGRVTLPPFQNARLGSRHWRLNPTASRIVFERHAGTVNQVWAIDNLLSFIQSGRPAMARPVRR